MPPTVTELVCFGFGLGVADVSVGQSHDGIFGSGASIESAQDTVKNTDNFSGFKRSVPNVDE
jgi:hypothetical protein